MCLPKSPPRPEWHLEEVKLPKAFLGFRLLSRCGAYFAWAIRFYHLAKDYVAEDYERLHEMLAGLYFL